MNSKIYGRAIGNCFPSLGSEGDAEVKLSPNGDLRVAQSLPSKTEIVRLGRTWTFRNTDLVVAAIAVPTTAAPVVLYNGNGAGTDICLIIDKIVALQHVQDATQSDACSVIYQIAPPGAESAVTDETNSKVNMAGKTATYSGNAKMAVDVTITDRGWFALGAAMTAGVTAVEGAIWKAQEYAIDGGIIIPPTAMLCLHALKLGAPLDNSMSYSITFHELPLLLG